ncbi:PadR family transcriptional regulator [Pedobacter sp. BMA]|uniref:PadR family transcriptional regulator n=1 Tax=Pedobacter sp. BMA TaxID=1663685 RepID=UPI00064AB094|nr:PadR family transcriptional regulator [Pedobacter sp. BMA]KLT65780.1 PadR family transcriptional regulator [Pedobacter sp. BMA]
MIEINKELMAGSLTPIVLLILRRQESYGYQIIQELKDKTEGELAVAEGTLYPILKKMESKDWIKGEWKRINSGRERKYYTLTKNGQKELDTQYTQLNFINDLITKLWNPQTSL